METWKFYGSSAIVLFISFTILIHYLLNWNFFNRFFVFDADKLHKLCLSSIKANGPSDTEAIVKGFVDRLNADRAVSKYLNLRQDWVLNNAGGAMGAVWIVHASITEYIIIFGTGTGTEGSTGRLTADDYFMLLQGTQLAFSAGSYKAVEYTQGMVHHLPRGQAQQMKMPGPCFAVGYARGWIPGLFPLGFADDLFSTADYRTLWDTMRITTREVVGNLLRGKI